MGQQPGCGGLPSFHGQRAADFEAAIEEGATLVRVGTLLFGDRSYEKGAIMPQAQLASFEKIKRRITIIHEIGKTLTSSLTVKEVVQQIFYKVAELFSPENWSLLLVNHERQELYFEIVVSETGQAEQIKDTRLKIGEGIAGWVAKTGRPLLVPSVDKEPRFTRKADDGAPFSTESIICIPLKIRDKVLGVIEFVNRNDVASIHDFDIEMLVTVADFAAIALENARNFEQASKLTITDDITGLYNSRHLHIILQEEIDRALELGSTCSLIFFDLDFFKLVNDTHGHLCGSSLLGEMGAIVAGMLGENHFGARYGGMNLSLFCANRKAGVPAFCRELQSRLNSNVFLAAKGACHSPYGKLRHRYISR